MALVHASLGQRPRETFPPKRALKARIKEAFAKFDAVSAQKLAIQSPKKAQR
jgi:hypothetical protein